MKTFIFGLMTLLLTVSISAEDGWYWSTFMGGSISTHNSLKVKLDDHPDHTINARYSSRSFEDSHWWMTRIEKRKGNKIYSFEMIHHKIYLQNTNDIVESFSVSDGYNLLYFNIGRVKEKMRYRYGLGIIIAHPDVTIAGREPFHTPGLKGHYLAGPTMQFNVERLIWENKLYFVSLDTKLTLSYAWIPLSDRDGETAEAPDIAVHFSLGLGSKPTAFKAKGIKKAKAFLPGVYPAFVGKVILGTGLTP